MVHYTVLMSEDVAHADDSVEIRELVCNFRIRPTDPVQRLSQDLQLTFDCGLDEKALVKRFGIETFDKRQRSEACLPGIPEMSPRCCGS